MCTSSVDICCPTCLKPMERLEENLHCPGCQQSFEVVDGIPCVARNRQFYYGEVSQKQMQRLLAGCAQGPWQAAFNQMMDDIPYPEGMLNYAVNEGRAGWWPLLNISPNSRVLDLGCGWGAVSFGLAPRVSHVVACDLALDRLQFLRIRAEQEGFSNVQLLCGGDTPRLPFGDAAFDVVVMNGVLEWVPTNRGGRPYEAQLNFLREAARVLTPNGQLLLSLENRWSWLYFMGRPEDHVKIPYVSLLPRRLADVYARALTGEPYRTRTYSYRAYRRLLREAGFPLSQAFIPLPDYRSFGALVDPERPVTVRNFFAERECPKFEALQLTAKGLAARSLAPGFCWVANRGDAGASFLEDLTRHLAQKLPGRKGEIAEWVDFRVTGRHLIIITLEWKSGAPGVVIKIPLGQQEVKRCDYEQENLRLLHRRLSQSGHRFPQIPNPLLRDTFLGRSYFVEGMVPGLPGTRFARRARYAERAKAQAFAFIQRLHRVTCERAVLDEPGWKANIEGFLSPGLRKVEQITGVEAPRIADYLRSNFIGRTWPLVFSHGDYWSGNLLYDRNGECLTGVVDWDSSCPFSLPLLDALNVILFDRARQEQLEVVDLVGKCLERGHLGHTDDRLVEGYLQHMEIELSVDQWKAFLVLYWLWSVAIRLEWRSNKTRWEKEWLQKNVAPAAAWLDKTVASHEPRDQAA